MFLRLKSLKGGRERRPRRFNLTIPRTGCRFDVLAKTVEFSPLKRMSATMGSIQIATGPGDERHAED